MTLCILIPLSWLTAVLAGPNSQGEGSTVYRQTALDAACWIRSAAIPTDRGTSWPADPKNPDSVNSSLYSGVTGVVLFFLEAHRATGDKSYLKDARAGADYLLSTLADVQDTGLYTGIAGIGFALQEVYKATRDDQYRDGVKRCVRMLKERAREVGRGIEWNGVTDIISGSAGTGLFLLYAAKELGDDAARELAAEAGERLIELARPSDGGLKWPMHPESPRLMPNFSHGTAGVAYFLACLHGETKRKEFLDAARAGAEYLKAIAETDDGVCLIFHHEPADGDLFYLGWCHGPVGTARLFYRLHQVTGEEEWMEWVKRCGRGVMDSGIPEKRTPGFWDNVSQCCGSAGVVEFFLDLHRATGERAYRNFAERVADDMLGRATRDAGGVRWVQAEHRVKPDFRVAQTGYMQGAAGIGVSLLHLDAQEGGREGRIRLPDDPF